MSISSQLVCLCWVLFMSMSKGVVNCRRCRRLPTEFQNRDINVDTTKSGEYLHLSFWLAKIRLLIRPTMKIWAIFLINFCVYISKVDDTERQHSSEFQLEKSILNHDQGKTRKPLQKQRRRQQHYNSQKRQKKRQLDGTRIRAHDFNAFEADYVDFGALIGQNGAFSWHANYSPDWDKKKTTVFSSSLSFLSASFMFRLQNIYCVFPFTPVNYMSFLVL